MASDSPHAHPPHAHSLPHSPNHPFADGSQAGQPNGVSTKDDWSRSGSTGQEPSSNNVSNLDHLIEN